MERPALSRGRGAVRLAAALLAVPIAVDLAITGTRGLFRYVAADTFYYLQVARTWAQTGRPSFDGVRPTNGFHPLWQAVLAGAAWVLRAVGLGNTALLWTAVLLSLALLLVAVVWLGRALEVAHGSVTPFYALLPLGVYAISLLPVWLALGSGQEARTFWGVLPLYGTLWSFASGMESAAAVAAYAALVLATTRDELGATRRGLTGMTVAAALLVLARLDTGLVVAAWVVVLGAAAARRRDRGAARTALVVTAGVGAVVVAYLLANRLYDGRALPVSGSTKSTFPHASLDNLRDLRDLVRGDGGNARSRLYRHWPMLVPAAVAIGWLASRARVRNRVRGTPGPVDRYRLALTATALGVLAESAYDELFVPLFDQGWWYLPVSTVFVSLVGLEALRGVRAPAAAVLAVTAAASVAVFATLAHPAGYHAGFARFYLDEAPQVRAHYGADPPRLFAWEDGIDAYALGFPAMSGTGLMLDPAAWDAWYHGRLIATATARGFDRFSSVSYLDTRGLSPQTPATELRRRLQPLVGRGEHLSRYDLRVEERAGDYVVIRMRPR